MGTVTVGSKECSISAIIKVLFSSDITPFLYSWHEIANSLNLPTHRVRKLKQDLLLEKTTLVETIFVILEEWVAQRGSQAKLNILVSALESSGLSSFGDRLQKEFRIIQHTNAHAEAEASNHLVKISAAISYYPNSLLGVGRMRTKIFTGNFKNQTNVAIKQIFLEFVKKSSFSAKDFGTSDFHENVVRYYGSEIIGDYLYIAQEKCDANLKDWVTNNQLGSKIKAINKYEIIFQTLSGLNFIHSMGLIHRDIKPEHILLLNQGEKVVVKISDFGLGSIFEKESVSYLSDGHETGTKGWQAPEVVKPKTHKLTNKIDVFSLGCLAYYVLTEGKHPFGDIDDPFIRQYNIRSDNYDITDIPDDTRGIQGLVAMMIANNAKKRPSVSAVLTHPMLWSSQKVIGFFNDVHHYFITNQNQVSTVISTYESGRDVVFPQTWVKYLSFHFKMEVERYARDQYSIQELVKSLRNKYNNYNEMSMHTHAEIGGKAEYINYWLEIFPRLLPYTWQVFEGLKYEKRFQKYYDVNFNFF